MSSTVNVAVLVGNGFDLSAGLRTSARDFIAGFVDAHKQDDGESPTGRLARSIETDGIETWADYEMRIGEYAARIPDSLGEEGRADEYARAKEALDRDLLGLVSTEAGRLSGTFAEKNAAECIDSLCSWISLLRPRERRRLLSSFATPIGLRYRFVCFNYTPLLEIIFEEMKDKAIQVDGLPSEIAPQYVRAFTYAHGTVADCPITGVNDAGQIADEQLASSEVVVRTVVKPEAMALIGADSDIRGLECISNADIVLIFGMSLGMSDRRWWERVVKLLTGKENSFAVIFSLGLENVGQTPLSYLMATEGKKGRLLDASGIKVDPETRRSLFERIFVLPSKEVLKIKEPVL